MGGECSKTRYILDWHKLFQLLCKIWVDESPCVSYEQCAIKQGRHLVLVSAPAMATVDPEQPVGGREYTLPAVVPNFLLSAGATIKDSFW